MTDSEVMDMLREKPEEGLGKVIDTYSRLVYAVVSRKLSRLFSREDIEETVSDVFYQFYLERDRIDESVTPVKACLMTIATRRATDKYRRARGISFTEIPEDDTDAPCCEGPEEEYCAKEERDKTSDAIKSLGEPDSSIIIRRYWFGEKVNDIAKALNMSPNAVTKRIKRSHERLAALLDGQ